MSILVCSNKSVSHLDLVLEILGFGGDEVVLNHEVSTPELVNRLKPDCLASDRNGHILSQETLNVMEGRTVNIHASLLPNHGGWQPIFFRLESRPRGCDDSFHR